MGKDRYRGVRGFIIEKTHTWAMELTLFERGDKVCRTTLNSEEIEVKDL